MSVNVEKIMRLSDRSGRIRSLQLQIAMLSVYLRSVASASLAHAHALHAQQRPKASGLKRELPIEVQARERSRWHLINERERANSMDWAKTE